MAPAPAQPLSGRLLAAALLACLAAGARGQAVVRRTPVSPLPPVVLPTLQAVDYTLDGTGNAYQFLHYFESPFPGFPDGHPVIVWFSGGGFQTVGAQPLVNPNSALVYEMMSRGWAVVNASYTITDPQLPGGGLFPAPELDAVAVVQWIRHRASLPESDPGHIDVDPDRIFLAGKSAGAIVAAYTALGVDRASTNPADPRQRKMSSRVAGLVLRLPILYWPAYRRDLTWGAHFTTVPGAQLDHPSVDPRLLEDASALVYAFDDPARNASLPILLDYAYPPGSDDHTGPPWIQDVLDPTAGPAGLHDSWNGFAMWAELLEQSPGFHAEKSLLLYAPTPLSNLEGARRIGAWLAARESEIL